MENLDESIPLNHPVACSMSQACGMLCVASMDGYFKQLNPAWAVRLGWTLEELQARPFVDFVHPHDRAATLAELAKLNAGAETIAFENRYIHRDGTYRWLHWTAKPVPGRPLVQAAARDVTDQRRLEKEIVEISDREKDRLGRDLHDGLCQNLAGIAALSTTLGRQLAQLNVPAAAAAAEIAQLLNQAVAQARDLARGLNPVELDGIGLIGALDTLASNIQAIFRLTCAFRCNHRAFRLPAEVETHLYRIAQEAVQNAVKHGRARRIFVTLSLGSGQGTLAIRDDGVGIPPNYGAGNGMHTMNYRARLIGASLWMQALRRGTRLACVFGLPPGPDETTSHA
jgi:PAS domain S-box-containing protein